MSDPPRLDDWRMQALMRLLGAILTRAHAADPSAPKPPPGVLVTTFGPPAAPKGQVAWVSDIRVNVTLPDGQVATVGFDELCILLVHQPHVIRAVEPLTSYLAFVLYIHDRLWAWDFRPVVVAMAADTEVWRRWGLLSQGPKGAQAHRRAVFWALPEEERKQVIRDTVTSDIVEPGRTGIPLRGILHAGWHFFDTEEPHNPFRILKLFDTVLGLGRKTATPASALSPGERLAFDTASIPVVTDSVEDLIQEMTAALPPQERVAVQHFLRAESLDVDFKRYCADYGLVYKTLHQAVRRGLKKLQSRR